MSDGHEFLPVQRHEIPGLARASAYEMCQDLLDYAEEAQARDRALWVLDGIRAALSELEAEKERFVMLARDEGALWEEIGDALGVSKQAVAKKYGKTE